MFLKRILPLAIILAAAVFGSWHLQKPCGQAVDSTLQNGWQGSFEVRVERKPDTCDIFPALAGAKYAFTARQANSNEWREIMTVDLDDPIDIPKESLHIFNENAAAVFMKYNYAFTTDKGKSWTVLEIEKDLGLEKYTKFAWISHINFGEDGFVVMNIKAIGHTGREMDLPFVTHNFGKTWEVLTK